MPQDNDAKKTSVLSKHLSKWSYRIDMNVDDLTEEQAEAIFKYFESKIGKKIDIKLCDLCDRVLHNNPSALDLAEVTVDNLFFTIKDGLGTYLVLTPKNLGINMHQENIHKAILRRFFKMIKHNNRRLTIRRRHSNTYVMLLNCNQPIEELLIQADLIA